MAERYVSNLGNDNNSGTQTSPYKTVAKANSVSVAGDVIYIVGGYYYDIGNMLLKPNVNLIGTVSNGYSPVLQGTLEIQNSSNITVGGFYLSGRVPSANYYLDYQAIYAVNCNNLLLANIYIDNYRTTALNLYDISNSTVQNVSIYNCTYNNNFNGGNAAGGQSTAIILGNLNTVVLERIELNTLSRGGRGIGSHHASWDGNNDHLKAPASLNNFAIRYSNFQVDRYVAWGSGYITQMAIELWHTECRGYINNNVINGCVSLISFLPNFNSTNPHYIRLCNNHWHPVMDGVGQKSYYAIEAGLKNHRMEIDHNYFSKGSYPIANFDDTPVNPVYSIHAHHNLFVDGEVGSSVINFSSPVVDYFKFEYNTIYNPVSSGAVMLHVPRENNASSFQYNIIHFTDGVSRDIFGNWTKNINHNQFFGHVTKGSNASTIQANFAGTPNLNNEDVSWANATNTTNKGARPSNDNTWVVGY